MAIRLKPKYISAIQASPDLQAKIALAIGKSTETIKRWCRENSEQLTMLSVLNKLREELKTPRREKLTEEQFTFPVKQTA